MTLSELLKTIPCDSYITVWQKDNGEPVNEDFAKFAKFLLFEGRNREFDKEEECGDCQVVDTHGYLFHKEQKSLDRIDIETTAGISITIKEGI